MINEEFESHNVLIDDLNISTRIANSLIKQKINTVSDLEKLNEKELIKFKGIGKKAIQDLKNEYRLIFQRELFNSNLNKELKSITEDNSVKKENQIMIVKKIERYYTPLKKIDYRKRLYLNQSEKQRILDIKKLYDKYGSLQQVGNDLKMTRERIRQILNTGNKFGLFKYEAVRKTKFRNLTIKVTKEKLTEEIFKDKTIFEICNYFDIKTNQYFRLIKFYKIDTFGKRMGAKRIKYILKYKAIVDRLGHDPTTTELNSKPEWANVWQVINCYWGNIENFRKENYIKKPVLKIHTYTNIAWKKEVSRKKNQKENKIQNIINLMKNKIEVNQVDIKNTYKYKTSTLNLYIKEMTNKNLIKKRREGIHVFYSLK